MTIQGNSWLYVLPVFVLAGAGISLDAVQELRPEDLRIAFAVPYLIAGAGGALALHFHRGRPLVALALIALFYGYCRHDLADGLYGLERQGMVYAFSILLPLATALLAVVRERGILTPLGRWRLLLFACGTALVLFFFRWQYGDLLPLLTQNYLQHPAIPTFALPQIPVAITLVCLALTTGVVVVRRSPMEVGCLGAMVALFIACNGASRPVVPLVFTAAAALLLTMSILQDTYDMAFRDELTGIPGRRALNEALNGVGKTYVIAMVDVDHFKKFNDTHGHDVGDQVLRLVAKRLAGVGGGGKAFRYGGEEFAILFPSGSAEDAHPYLDAVREEIANYPMAIRAGNRPQNQRSGKRQRRGAAASGHVSVTVSIGVAGRSEGARPEAVIKAADKALYQAKHAGRNQVVLAP